MDPEKEKVFQTFEHNRGLTLLAKLHSSMHALKYNYLLQRALAMLPLRRDMTSTCRRRQIFPLIPLERLRFCVIDLSST